MVEVKTYERVTAYEVCALPPEHPDADLFRITVELRGPDSWAVLRRSAALSVDGTWGTEPLPSERHDEWLAAHRFPLERALKLAREVAPSVTVNGMTISQVAEFWLEEG